MEKSLGEIPRSGEGIANNTDRFMPAVQIYNCFSHPSIIDYPQ